MAERIVLTVSDADLMEYLDKDVYETIVENGLVDQVLDRACKYMWMSLDGGDFYYDSISEATSTVCHDNGIPLD